MYMMIFPSLSLAGADVAVWWGVSKWISLNWMLLDQHPIYYHGSHVWKKDIIYFIHLTVWIPVIIACIFVHLLHYLFLMQLWDDVCGCVLDSISGNKPTFLGVFLMTFCIPLTFIFQPHATFFFPQTFLFSKQSNLYWLEGDEANVLPSVVQSGLLFSISACQAAHLLSVISLWAVRGQRGCILNA